MGSDRSKETARKAAARCCYGASFALGFLFTTLAIATMFWIAWCYFGLAVVQISDTQRRALVNYSYTTSKPSPTPSTSSPNRPTPSLASNAAGLESSANSISKLSTLPTALRGSSRVQPTTVTEIPTRTRQDDIIEKAEEKAAILSGSSAEVSDDDRIYARRVSSSGSENHPEEPEKKLGVDTRPVRRQQEPDAVSRIDIAPTQVYDYDSKSGRSRSAGDGGSDRPPREDVPDVPKEYLDRDRGSSGRRDDIQSSRRTEKDPVYRDPDFDRDYPRRYADRERSRYVDDDDDDRSVRSRYDRRDRGRDTDDRLSKGDTRVYPDDERALLERERISRPSSTVDDRYRDRIGTKDDRYRERRPDGLKRVDDEDYDDRRYRSRDSDGTSRKRDRFEDEKYDPRDGDRYRLPDDDRYLSRDDDRYRIRGDDRYRLRDDDRYIGRDDERFKARPIDDDRSERIPVSSKDRIIDDKDVYRPRIDDDKYADSDGPRYRDRDLRDSKSTRRIDDDLMVERRPLRSDIESRGERRISSADRDLPRSYPDDSLLPERSDVPIRSVISESSKYRDRSDDDYRRPSRIDDRDDRILPSRTRDEVYISRSTFLDPREEARYIDDRRDVRPRDDKYIDDDRRTKIDDSRGVPALSSSGGSRRRGDDRRDEYRTRLPDDRKIDINRDEVVLDRRSYASEEADEYRSGSSRSRLSTTYDYDDSREKKPLDDSRRDYRDDERFSRRVVSDDEDYRRSRPRGDYDDERTRYRDRYDEEYRRYDRDDDRYARRDEIPSSRKYDTYLPEDDRSNRRRSSVDGRLRSDDSIRTDDRITRPRQDRPTIDEDRAPPRDSYSSSRSSDSRRYDDDLPRSIRRDLKDTYSVPPTDLREVSGPSRQAPRVRDSLAGSSSKDPIDVIIREKRYQNSRTSSPSNTKEARGDSSEYDRDASSVDAVGDRPLSAKEVIEAALRQSDSSDQNSRKVHYPVFDPRVSNLTSPEIIRPSERRGTTITAKKRKRRATARGQ